MSALQHRWLLIFAVIYYSTYFYLFLIFILLLLPPKPLITLIITTTVWQHKGNAIALLMVSAKTIFFIHFSPYFSRVLLLIDLKGDQISLSAELFPINICACRSILCFYIFFSWFFTFLFLFSPCVYVFRFFAVAHYKKWDNPMPQVLTQVLAGIHNNHKSGSLHNHESARKST